MLCLTGHESQVLGDQNKNFEPPADIDERKFNFDLSNRDIYDQDT